MSIPNARERMEGSMTPTSVIYEGRYWPGDALYFSGPSILDLGRYKVSYDFSTPNYRTLVKQGAIINNPCEIETITRTATPMFRDFYDAALTRHYTGQYWVRYAPYLGLEADLSDLVDQATTSAFAKLNDSEASIIVTLMELRETKEMILKGMISLWKFRDSLWNLYCALRRKQKYKTVANLWLQVRYGWMPFAYDARALIDAYNRLTVPQKRNRKRFTSSRNVFLSDEDTHYVTDGSTWGHYFERRTTISGTVRAGVLCDPRWEGVIDPFGITQVPLALYDLTTLSFVLDWFFNVADFIAAWSPSIEWRPLAAWTVKDLTINKICRVSSSVRLNGGTGSVFGLSYGEEILQYKREIIFHPPYLPDFRCNMNWKRYVDALALGRKQVVGLAKECINIAKHLSYDLQVPKPYRVRKRKRPR